MSAMSTSDTERLLLKSGKLHSWKLESDASFDAMKRYFEAGKTAEGQQDTQEQKKHLCDLIDALDGRITIDDWHGEAISKDEAKAYVMTYRSPQQARNE